MAQVTYILNRFTRLVIPLFCLGLCPTLPLRAEECTVPVFDDWVCSPTSNTLCGGYYEEAPLPFKNKDKAALKTLPTTLTADHAEFKSEGDSYLKGHVHLIDGNQQLFSDTATIHRDPKAAKGIDQIEANGHVKLTSPGLRIDGPHAKMFPKTNTEMIENATYRLYDRHARGTAQTITVYDRTKMDLKNATYTTCRPSKDTWVLKANHVRLNKKTGRGRARHAKLYFYNVPIFYMPYIDFPIDDRRQTGFLFPTYGHANRSGFELGAPFYWNLAPNYDATLTPTLYTQRGLEFKGQFRYLLGQSDGELNGAFLPNDRKYRAFKQQSLISHPGLPNNDPRVTGLQKNNNRAAFNAKHKTQFNEHWSGHLNYDRVSDDNYFVDLGNTLNLVNTTQLLQRGNIRFEDDNWRINTQVQQYQTLHPFNGPAINDPYRILPQVKFEQSDFELPYNLEWQTQGEVSRFEHKKNPLTQNAFTTGDRFHMRPGLALPIRAPGWFIKPRLQADFLGYNVKLGPTDQTALRAHPSRVLPILDIDSGLIFERSLQFQKTAYLQTLEPRLYYLYVPYRNQNTLPNFDTSYPGFDYNQLYRDNRFTSIDRLGDANQVTLGFTSRFMSEKTSDEKLNLSLGQIFYFKNRAVSACNKTLNPLCVNEEYPNGYTHHRSSLVGLARLYLIDHWSTYGNAEWDPYQKRTDKKALGVQYQPDDASVVNFGYQFLRRNPTDPNPITGVLQRLDQTDTSFAWPITTHWRVLARWHYDLHNRRSNEILMGLEQQGCCTAVRLTVNRFLEPFDSTRPNATRKYAKGIFLQFVFKGFAGVGNGDIQQTVKRIPGYQWRNDQY